MTTLPQELLKAALAQTDTWLDRAHDLWTENQSNGKPMHRGFPSSEDGTSGEHRALGMSEFQALWEGLGYGVDRPLPPEVARHRSSSGSTVIDELLMVRLRSARLVELSKVNHLILFYFCNSNPKRTGSWLGKLQNGGLPPGTEIKLRTELYLRDGVFLKQGKPFRSDAKIDDLRSLIIAELKRIRKIP